MITEGHLSQHYQGRKGGRSPALIDIAQDHALALINPDSSRGHPNRRHLHQIDAS